eukprot:g1593.t1
MTVDCDFKDVKAALATVFLKYDMDNSGQLSLTEWKSFTENEDTIVVPTIHFKNINNVSRLEFINAGLEYEREQRNLSRPSEDKCTFPDVSLMRRAKRESDHQEFIIVIIIIASIVVISIALALWEAGKKILPYYTDDEEVKSPELPKGVTDTSDDTLSYINVEKVGSNSNSRSLFSRSAAENNTVEVEREKTDIKAISLKTGNTKKRNLANSRSIFRSGKSKSPTARSIFSKKGKKSPKKSNSLSPTVRRF